MTCLAFSMKDKLLWNIRNRFSSLFPKKKLTESYKCKKNVFFESESLNLGPIDLHVCKFPSILQGCQR